MGPHCALIDSNPLGLFSFPAIAVVNSSAQASTSYTTDSTSVKVCPAFCPSMHAKACSAVTHMQSGCRRELVPHGISQPMRKERMAHLERGM